MLRYRYYAGSGGRIFCYHSDATLVCPYQQRLGTAENEYPAAIAELRAVVEAAGLANPPDVLRLMLHAHRASGIKDDGTCDRCGARAEKLGYYAWAEEPWPDVNELRDENKRFAKLHGWSDEDAAARLSLELSNRSINIRLNGPDALRHVPRSGRYWSVKREAIQWAREQAEIDRAAAREEARV